MGAAFTMPLPPLTHHEILGLIAPFTTRGRRVDLDASDRLARRLVFRPLEHPAGERGPGGLQEALELESPYRGTFRLIRTVTHPGGLKASLVAEGPSPEAVLAQADALPPTAHFRAGEGYLLALSHRAEQPGAAPVPALLTAAEARVGGLTFTASLTGARGAADLRLADAAGDSIELPEDLLAVLGWNWSPLARDRDGWSGKLRLRGAGAERRRRAEEALELATRHLATTLAEPPPRFHQRFLAARWGSVFRRVIPVLTAAALVTLVASLPREALEEPALRLVLLNVPLLVIGLSFTLQERSRVELPPWPRALRAPAWRRAPAAG